MPFGQQQLCTFQSTTPRYKATNCQHSLRKDAMALSRGAYSAGARSALMRMRTQCMPGRLCIFGAPWRSRLASTKKN